MTIDPTIPPDVRQLHHKVSELIMAVNALLQLQARFNTINPTCGHLEISDGQAVLVID